MIPHATNLRGGGASKPPQYCLPPFFLLSFFILLCSYSYTALFGGRGRGGGGGGGGAGGGGGGWARAQDVLANPSSSEIGERRMHEGITDDEQRPTFADGVQRACHGDTRWL